MLPDYLRPNLSIVFVGTSVATASALRGHYYSGAGNRFWALLRDTGLTGDSLLGPDVDATVLDHGIGLTDLVKRKAASSDSLLRSSDYDVVGLLDKIDRYKPRALAFNGRKAAQRVARRLGESKPVLGPATWRISGVAIFVLPSSSSSSSNPRDFAPKASKSEWWSEIGEWFAGWNPIASDSLRTPHVEACEFLTALDHER